VACVVDRRSRGLLLTTGQVNVDARVDTARSLVRRIDRSRLLSLALALAFPLVTIRAGQLFSATQLRVIFEMPLYRFGRFSPPIASLVHGRPLEVCPSIGEEYARRFREQRRNVRGFRRLAAMARDYHRTSREVMLGKCSGGWVWQPGSQSHLYAQFARDAPIAWIFKRLGGSEVLIGLFVLMSGLLGSYGLARLVLYLTNSNIVLALALGVFAWTVSQLFRIVGLEVLWTLYGVLTCWLIACWNRESTQRSRLAAPGLVAALMVHLAAYMMVAYSAALGPIAVSIGAMSLSVVARPSRQRVLQLIAVAAVVWLAIWDCAAFSKRQLAPISTLNFAGSGSFGEFALSTGFWTERPSPVSFPIGDGGVYSAYLAEPLFQEGAAFIYEYQGFEAFGKALLRATVWSHPVTAIESLFKRLFIFLVKLPILAQPLAARSPWFVRTLQLAATGTLVLAVLVLRYPARWHLELPILLIPLWNVFGIEMLTHLIHTHPFYHLFGLMQLMVLAPVLVLIAADEARARVPLRRRFFIPKRKVAIAGYVFALVVLASWSYTAARRELRTFDIWYHPWIGMYRTPLERESLEPAIVADKIEQLRALGEPTPGSISMYAVWMMSRLATNVWVPEADVGEKLRMTREEVERRRTEARRRAVEYFRRAAAEAPDDPWIRTFTDMWDPENVTSSFARLLQRHSEHPFAPWWAYVLARRTTGATQGRYATLFDELTHRQLVRTAGLRPGFVQRPGVENSTLVGTDTDSADVRLTGEGAALIGSTGAFGSDRLGLLVYVRAISGAARASLVVQTDAGITESPEQGISDSDVHRYRLFMWSGSSFAHRMALQLRGDVGQTAIIRVRDFYPLVENPRVSTVD